ncbi:MAG: glycosyltransferase family 4 protein [Bdellovibrionales bacterium]|nr:glycosyltransferase family 4 protein [Bdellovibrionales bacterium]
MGNKKSLRIALWVHSGAFQLKATLNSISAALDELSGTPVQICVFLNRFCQITPRILKTWSQAHKIIYYSDAHLRSKIVNKTIKSTAEDFLFLLSSDDLISKNWLKLAILNSAKAKTNNEILHSDQIYFWGKSKSFYRNPHQSDISLNRLLWRNFWTGPVFLSRTLFLKCPISKISAGFSDPWWTWSCDLISRGGTHRPIAETYSFQHSDSQDAKTFLIEPELRVGQPSVLFNKKSIVQEKSKMKRVVLRKSSEEKRTLQNILDWGQTGAGDYRFEKIDNLYGTFKQINFPADESKMSELFFSIKAQIGDAVDYLIVMHQLRRGGSELAALHHINALRKIRPRCRIVILTTALADQDWSERFPKDVQILNFGRIAGQFLDRPQQRQLMLQLFTHVKPKVLHVIYAWNAWDILRDAGAAIRNHTKIYVSLYCLDYDQSGRVTSYAHTHLPHCAHHIDLIFSDNKPFVKHLHDQLGIQNSKVTFLPTSVVPRELLPDNNSSSKKTFRVLWASRICWQKNIQLVFDLARILKDFEFHMYGEISENFENLYEQLHSLPNLKYFGTFDGFESLPYQQYDVYLHTSRWDGTPNILLEAGQKGLPIITSAVGGIPDLINDKTGYLANTRSDYLKHLISVFSRPEAAHKKSQALQKLIQARHSEAAYLCNLREAIT